MLKNSSRFSVVTLANAVLLFFIVGLGSFSAHDANAASKSVANPLFAYTHLLPSPYTMPAGTAYIGTDAAVGITDFMQLGTSVIRDLYQDYNAQLKLQLIDTSAFAFGLTMGFEHYNFNSFSNSNPDLPVTIYSPGAVMAFGLFDWLAWYVGGNINYYNVPVSFSGLSSSSFIRGTVVNSDIAIAYSASKKGGIANVVALGASYDTNYKLWGFGLSHYWGGFRLGFHYYPKATSQPVLPLITGSTVVNF